MAKNWAIAVGINKYSNLTDLKYAKGDAEVVKDLLLSKAGFDQVFLFTDDSPEIAVKPSPICTQPTFGHLRRFLRAQFNRKILNPGDNLWFFFAGHGIQEDNRDYLMLSDSDPGDVEHTAIAVHYITEQLRGSGADNVVLFLDACRDIGARGGGIGEEHRGVVTFYSCAPKQKAYEIEALQQGAFTYALIEALQIQGVGNCATVERLEQYLSRRVPEINRQYQQNQGRQTPYAIPEPASKLHLILLPKYATLADIADLKVEAFKAEQVKDYELARQLWIQVNIAAGGSDMDAIEAFPRIAQIQRQSSTSSSTGGRGQGVESVAQREAQHQQNLVEYGQRFSQAVEQEFPLSKASCRQLKSLQQYLQLTDKEVSQIEQPINDRKQEEYRQRQEEERIRQQREAQRLRQQKREAQRRKQQQQLEQWRQLFANITTPINRRGFLKWAGLGGGGLVTVLVGREIFNQSSPILKPQQPKPISLEPFEFKVVTVNSQGKITPHPDKTNSREANLFTEDLGNGVTLEMVSIPGGSFEMGSPLEEKGRSKDEGPQRNVKVSAFFMGRFEVTQAQYQAIMGKNPSSFKGDKRPVDSVSWNDAVEFCKKLSQKTGRTYRLPSEAQWEYACRAGTSTPFHFGETITTEIANYRGTDWKPGETLYPGNYGEGPKGEYRGKTTDVGSFPANRFGLYDMHGNLWEWCEDIWHKNYEGAPRDGKAWVKSGDNSYRVLRGGSWNLNPENCRSAYRNRYNPDDVNFSIGLRVVCVVAPRTLK